MLLPDDLTLICNLDSAIVVIEKLLLAILTCALKLLGLRILVVRVLGGYLHLLLLLLLFLINNYRGRLPILENTLIVYILFLVFNLHSVITVARPLQSGLQRLL